MIYVVESRMDTTYLGQVATWPLAAHPAKNEKLDLGEHEPPKKPREPLPPDGHGDRWAYDWRGRQVNLWGTLPGEKP
jgi:hypothetical protein